MLDGRRGSFDDEQGEGEEERERQLGQRPNLRLPHHQTVLPQRCLQTATVGHGCL